MSKSYLKSFILKTALILSVVVLPGQFFIFQAKAEQLNTDIEQLDFANGLLERKFYSMAVEEFDKFVKQYPKSEYLFEAYFGIAEGYFLEEKYKEAKKAFQDYLAKFPEKTKMGIVHMRYGQAMYFLEEYENALEPMLYVGKREMHKDVSPPYYFYMGLLYQKLGQMKNAIEAHTKGITLNPNSKYASQSSLEIGNIYAINQKFDQASLHFEKAIKAEGTDSIKSLALYKQGEINFLDAKYELAVKKFTRIIDTYPKETITPKALEYLLITLFRLEKHKECTEMYQKYVEMILDRADLMEGVLTVVDAYSYLNNTEQAKNLLDKAMTIKDLPEINREEILLKKAEVFIHNKEYKNAINLLNAKNIAFKTLTDQWIFLRGESYYALKKYKDSKKLYEQLIKEYPSSKFYESALLSLAYSEKALGLEKEAMANFKTFSKGKFSPEKRQQAHYNALVIAANQNNFKEAISIGEDLLKTYRENIYKEEIIYLLGTAYSKNQQYDQAAQLFLEFIESYPKSPKHIESKFLYAYNLQLAKKYDKAMNAYKEIDLTDETREFYVLALKNQALIHVTNQNEDEAAKIFQKLIIDFKGEGVDSNTYFWLAKRYLDQKKYKDIVVVFNRVDTKGWDSEEVNGLNYFKAESFRSLNQYEFAIKFYDLVINSKEPNSYVAASYIHKALSLKELKRFDEAIVVLEEVLGEFGSDNTIAIQSRYELADSQELKGDNEKAAKYYMLVALLYEDKEYVPKALFKAASLFEKLQKSDEALKVYKELTDRFSDHTLSGQAQERIKQISAL